jgi:hypothetical protein
LVRLNDFRETGNGPRHFPHVFVETFEPGKSWIWGKGGFQAKAGLPETRLADGANSTISEAATIFSKIWNISQSPGGGMPFKGAPKAAFSRVQIFFLR